ncbi:Fic family protein [Myxococcus vastator]|uniref:Fic family protein n=1 Tax=Myxococcus vastator TaxID=2709664 RepID=UPI0013D7FA35|nr:Fic family protein [Myxococcus vastator]
MRLPSTPPELMAALRTVWSGDRKRFDHFLAHSVKSEVGGRYLHWDELRRRPPPDGLTSEEWWAGISMARSVLRTEVPFKDDTGRGFHFARTDSLMLALHRIDREMGGRLEVADPQLANREVRDRYIVRSLMEEAITSSQLEGASTTRQVAKDMLMQGRPPRTKDERMIYNNFHAMEVLREKAREPLTEAFLLELHELITRDTLNEPGDAGRLRRSDETITVQDRSSGQTLHIPPKAGELPARIKALCAFANEDAGDAFIHPVVRAIVLHFMLAYDHPFVDGNGRTARALFYWSMIRQRYWLAEFLSISRIIQRAPRRYGEAFLHVETDRGDLTYFLLHQVEAIIQATQQLYEYLELKSKELREVELILRDGENINHRQLALLEYVLRHPGTRYTIESYRRQHRVVYQTARQDLLSLESAGYLQKKKMGRSYTFSAVPQLERMLRAKRA